MADHEPMIRIGPSGHFSKARLLEHIEKFGLSVFVTVFRMDAFSGQKIAPSAFPCNRGVMARLQMHLDPLHFVIEDGFVSPVLRLEVRCNETVEMQKEVQIEGGSDSKRIIVGGFQDQMIFQEVHSDEKGGILMTRLVDPSQEVQGIWFRKISD